MKSGWKHLTFVICILSIDCGDSKTNDTGSGGASANSTVGGQGLGDGTAGSYTGGRSASVATSNGGATTTAISTAGKSGALGNSTKTKGAGAGGKAATKSVTGGATAGSSGSGAGTVTQETPSDGTLPPVSDVWAPGPFTLATKSGAGPSNNATIFYPRELGEKGVKHPIVTWGNGATVIGPLTYAVVTQHVATHGFVVYTTYESSDQGTELLDGINWLIAENDRSGSEFYQMLDVTKVASMGHSKGSIATYSIAGDPRLTTTIHLSGGTNPDIAIGHEPLASLHAPVMFICGQDIPGADGLITGDTASPWCQYDFENVKVPVWFAVITGASHLTSFQYVNGAVVGWLRWRLTGDTNIKKLFVGDNCDLCNRPLWVVQQRGLE